jgi:hypothetical protein
MTGQGNHYAVDGEGAIQCVLCDERSATIEAHERHMEAVHDE